MSDLSMNCPECGAEIEIAEQLAAPLIEAERELIAQRAVAKAEKEFQQKLTQTEADLAEKAAKLESAERAELEARKATAAAEEAQRKVELEVQRKVDLEKQRVAEEAGQKARQELAARVEAAEKQNQEQATKLQAAEKAEIAARKAKSEAEDALRAAEVTVARRLDEERSKLREATLAEADEAHRLKVAEKEQQLEGMRRQIEELRRRGETGSQQLQGEVQEQDLTDSLEKQFPGDTFERIGKGQCGADVVQTVIGPGGLKCGTILWESKRTKAWSDDWLKKVRDDQRECRADISAIVTQTMPEGVSQFDCIENVWVTSAGSTLPMAVALRLGLIETAMARQALVGGNTKKEVVYNYLTGQEFRQRIGGLVDVYVQLRDDLDKEKRSYTRLWNSREKQLERMMHSMGGLYGDLQGMIGANLPEVAGLAFDAAAAPQLKLETVDAEEQPELTEQDETA